MDHGSTPDVARCGRELGEKLLSHEQGLNHMSSERDMGIMSLYSATSGYHNPPQWPSLEDDLVHQNQLDSRVSN